MNSTGFDSIGWQATLMWYSVGVYDFIDSAGYDAAQEAADAAASAGLQNPLWLRDKSGKFKDIDLPHLGRRSGPYCIALQAAFLVWTQCWLNDFPLPESQLLKAAHEGLMLWRKFHPEKTPPADRLIS